MGNYSKQIWANFYLSRFLSRAYLVKSLLGFQNGMELFPPWHVVFFWKKRKYKFWSEMDHLRACDPFSTLDCIQIIWMHHWRSGEINWSFYRLVSLDFMVAIYKHLTKGVFWVQTLHIGTIFTVNNFPCVALIAKCFTKLIICHSK